MTVRGRTQRSQGFTLIELMITVAIVGVLATIAGVTYGRWMLAAKTAEATSMIAAIKGAQELYRADTTRYLNVSESSLDRAYPLTAPSDQKAKWEPAVCTGTAVCDNFRILNVQADSSVYYRYSCIAGVAGTPPAIGGHTPIAIGDPWFEVQATGDLNNNKTYGYYYSTSFDSLVWSVNPEE